MSAINVVVLLPLWHGEFPPHNKRSNVSGYESTKHRQSGEFWILTPRQPVLPQGHLGIWGKSL